ncbi:MAG TPA: AbrB/MazE/SpoVT family DNA-binding domain-containing protein [Acidimicrobiales bacterium]|nr:AbrB/MazE/SpoVT family DNA-binding domain-containing protein [Acidimicrobiales bacterium]
MRVSVDAAGRLVIPKSLRTALGIGPDTELEIVVDGSGLRLEPVAATERTVRQRDGLPLLGLVPNMTVTDDDIRRLRDSLQR